MRAHPTTTARTTGTTTYWERHLWVGPDTEGRLTPSLPSGLAFLLAIWLGFAPFALHYRFPTVSGAGEINDVTTALVVASLALFRVIAPRDLPWLSLANATLGLWLVIAPFALRDTGSALATTNDIAVGVVLIALSGSSAVMTYRERRAENRQR